MHGSSPLVTEECIPYDPTWQVSIHESLHVLPSVPSVMEVLNPMRPMSPMYESQGTEVV